MGGGRWGNPLTIHKRNIYVLYFFEIRPSSNNVHPWTSHPYARTCSLFLVSFLVSFAYTSLENVKSGALFREVDHNPAALLKLFLFQTLIYF